MQIAVDLTNNFLNISTRFLRTPIPYMTTWNKVVCHFLLPKTFTWILAAIRGQLNMFLSAFLFIKLLFPFMNIQHKCRRFFGLLNIAAIFSTFASALPNLFEMTYDLELGECRPCQLEEKGWSKRTENLIRLLILFNVTHNFVVPMFVSIYFYQRLARGYRRTTSSKQSTKYRELRLLWFFDTGLFITCHLMTYMASIFGRYFEWIDFHPNASAFELTMFCSGLYSTLCPMVSLFGRKTYRKGFEDLLRSCFSLFASKAEQKHSDQMESVPMSRHAVLYRVKKRSHV
ncbi:hypothetical protein PHET_11845 [Paragonimus heterotremus]|uniref:G-protein coupled receptors family 1 profile domain-containing protein n=1 Tax=Paragonimus heterotremus TaxID=100268 RepID=A0A8J4T3P6_9TREM|nr:hypothetical protein PHET_11845 [Paragonimus heterotremus]